MFSLQAQQAFSFYTKQGAGGGSLSGIKLLESISTEQLEEQPQNLKLLLLGFFFSLQELRFLTWPMLFLHRRVGFAVSVLGEQPLLSAGQGDSSKRHLQMQQSLCWAHLIHMLCRKKSPDRFLHIPGWAQRKSGGSWRSPAAPSLLCLEERVWASGHNWHCRKLSICYQLSSDSVSATKCLGECFRTNHTFCFAGD